MRTWIRSGILRATGLALMDVAGRAAASVILVVVGACTLAIGVSGPGAEAAGLAGGPRVEDGASLSIFRVDVSQYPRIGLVVTVPGASKVLDSRNFTVTVGRRTLYPSVRQLSARDVELVLAPDAGLRRDALHTEQAAAARFLAGLPAGTQTMTVNPARPGLLPGRLSGDPAPSAAEVASLTPAGSSQASASLATALSAFTPGPRVRRTVVLVITRNQPLTGAAAAGFRQRLAASGTALYVLDAAPGGAPAYDALAVGSGGVAGRIRAPADWASQLSRIAGSLKAQYYLRLTDPASLPARAIVTVRTTTATVRGTARLPVSNPAAPPLPPPLNQSALGLPSRWDTPLILLAGLLIVIGVGYGMGMLAASRRDPPGPRNGRKPLPAAGQAGPGQPLPRVGGDLFFVFMMPCLNEEKVLLNSLQRLLSIPGDNFVVLVIDDGSDDRYRRRPLRHRWASGSGCSAASRRRRGRARARRSMPESAT